MEIEHLHEVYVQRDEVYPLCLLVLEQSAYNDYDDDFASRH